MPDTFTIDDSQQQALFAKFREYKLFNSREIPELLVHQGKEFSEDCFLLTPRADAQKIQNDVLSHAPQFIRAPKGFAQKIASTDSQVDDTVTKAARESRRVEADKLFAGATRRHKESRKKFIQRLHQERPEQAKKFVRSIRMTLGEQIKAAIIFRQHHIGSVAASWLNAMRKLGSKMNAAKSRPNKIYSDVAIIEGASPCVIVANKGPGVAKLARETGFISAALQHRIYDMQVYINKKRSQLATIFNPHGDK